MLQWPLGDHVSQVPSQLGRKRVTPGLGYVSDSTIQTQSGYLNCVVLSHSSHSMSDKTPSDTCSNLELDEMPVITVMFRCGQPALWINGPVHLSVHPTVRPSVCLSVAHLFHYIPSHRIVMNFTGLITTDQSDVHAKGQGQRSKVKVTEVKRNFAPICVFLDRNSSLNSAMATKWCI